MHELRVLFTAVDDESYLVQLTDTEGAKLGVEVAFAPFLSEEDFGDLRWYLEEYMDLPDGGAIVRAKGIEERLEEWGRKLHNAIFGTKENRGLKELLLSAPAPRVLTIATEDPALLRLPWELMADNAGSLAQRVSIRRQLDEPKSCEPCPVGLPLRILYVVSRPDDAGFIDPRLTTKAIFDALDPLGANARVDLCRPPTLARMVEMLSDAKHANAPYGIVHFDGHGSFDTERQSGVLCFERDDDDSGRSETYLVPADRLGEIFADQGVPLVVLGACRSAAVTGNAIFRSLAPRLIRSGVGSVLSMSHAVHVEATRRLLDRFYRELVRGATVGHAVAEGRKALSASRARWIEYGPRGRTVELCDWFLPQLYQRAADDSFVPPEDTAPQHAREFDLFLSHQHNDSDRVEALARELVEKHGLGVWLDKWECRPGKLRPQCEKGIRESRFTVVVGSKTALKSKWVQWEIRKHKSLNPRGERLLPIKFEKLDLPPKLDELLWVDFTIPELDAENAARLAKLIRSTDAEDTRRSRGFRSPAVQRHESGPFPPPPQYGFHGRARELHHMERLFRSHRGIVLHAMGGMGKTALATEAAHWWTRSGLFRDGACFISFEQFASADRVVQVLGTYLEGPMFDQLPAAGQRRRVLEVFRERDILIVWDNFESALPQFNVAPDQDNPYTTVERKLLSELFEDLTTGAGKGRLLVTCRPGHAGLPGALPYELHGLARPDSLWLLSNILKRDGISIGEGHLTRERIDLLLNDLADHPLSLELVGPHLRTLTPEAIRADFTKLLKKFEQDAPEGRNQSLFASLEFSRKHLNSAARDALPWLGLFRGGVFEDNLLDVSQLTPEAWEPICSELEGIALVRKEEDIWINGRPFLRFHPTLAFASTDSALAETPEVRERFIGVYLAFMRMLDRMLDGSQSRAALEILAREGANYRTAVHWAVIDRKLQAAATLGHTFHNFLKRSNRLWECDAWVRFLRDATASQGFTEEAADYEREHALTQYAQGDPKGAVEQIQALVERLRRTTEFDPTFQLALAIRDWGKMLDEAGASIQAVPILQEAVGRWEKLVERAGGRSWKALLHAEHYANAKVELGNLSTAMSYLAYALMGVRGLDEALAIAEAALEITQKLGHQKNISSGHIQCANILMDAGRYDEADARYKMALVAARIAGDKGLEGGILQNLGALAYDRDQLDRAERLHRKALRVFQVAGNHGAMMQTYNSLGGVELNAGRLAEARAWWKKSGELAKQLGDQRGLSNVAQNLGIVCQKEGEAARARGEEPAARRHFDEALRSVAESLEIEQSLGNKPGEAASLGQLAQIYLQLGNLDAAEFHAQEARKICESLGLKEAWMAYGTLSEIAEARGDTKTAAEWDQKRGSLRLELYRRIQGGFPPEMIRSLQGLTIACARAGCGDGKFSNAEEAALAQLGELPAPFPDFVAFLRRIATGQLTPIPNGLPPELRQLLEAAEQAVRKGRP